MRFGVSHVREPPIDSQLRSSSVGCGVGRLGGVDGSAGVARSCVGRRGWQRFGLGRRRSTPVSLAQPLAPPLAVASVALAVADPARPRRWLGLGVGNGWLDPRRRIGVDVVANLRRSGDPWQPRRPGRSRSLVGLRACLLVRRAPFAAALPERGRFSHAGLRRVEAGGRWFGLGSPRDRRADRRRPARPPGAVAGGGAPVPAPRGPGGVRARRDRIRRPARRTAPGPPAAGSHPAPGVSPRTTGSAQRRVQTRGFVP